MKTQRMFMISGFFFYNRFHPVTLTPITFKCFFGGKIYPADDGDELLTGLLKDDFGDSELSDVKLEGDNLSFTKCYVDRQDEIMYQFKRNEPGSNIWIGIYSGTKKGGHYAVCVLSEVPVEFDTPEFCMSTAFKPADPTCQAN